MIFTRFYGRLTAVLISFESCFQGSCHSDRHMCYGNSMRYFSKLLHTIDFANSPKKRDQISHDSQAFTISYDFRCGVAKHRNLIQNVPD